MSVYTTLSQADMEALLAQFDLGELLSFKGIEAGIENTNYFVTSQQQACVLTVFEHHQSDEVREFVRFALHLGSKGLLVPAPIADRQGQWLHTVHGKPAILCPLLQGHHISAPGDDHCYAIGAALANLHLAAADLAQERTDPRGFDWWQSMHASLGQSLSSDEQNLLADEVAHQRQQRAQWHELPQGWIHSDLFHDNALFVDNEQGAEVGAILDLYNACQGPWLYDLAIVANDWCCAANGQWHDGLVEALKAGYQSVRPFTDAEQAGWSLVLRAAALRFWLSRLLTQQLQQQQGGEMALQKDPAEYRDKLLLRRQSNNA
ncbi:homoserine kinase [Bacterioplanes sanyensis]|uniref:Homoserine kinase n=1 Tax=Bacterioplanes sanyensis TaxID=1249553 RepID=A0A222FHV7_9GAMM|nr:homoserine kinase [Bacterioplanes sanyensis]ASP38064.1 homoserine kinase [Bacterioplanes sanyensis]